MDGPILKRCFTSTLKVQRLGNKPMKPVKKKGRSWCPYTVQIKTSFLRSLSRCNCNCQKQIIGLAITTTQKRAALFGQMARQVATKIGQRENRTTYGQRERIVPNFGPVENGMMKSAWVPRTFICKSSNPSEPCVLNIFVWIFLSLIIFVVIHLVCALAILRYK